MVKKRLRRREAPVDAHSEDEEEFVTRGELELTDTSDSEEDSDIESEASHSEGEEETQEETSTIKEESTTTREELNLTKEKETNSTHEDASSLVEDTISTSNENTPEVSTKSKGDEKPISTSKQELKVESQPELEQGENNSINTIKDSDVDGDVSSTDGDEELQSRSGDGNEVQDEKCDDSKNSDGVPEVSGWQKKVLARQEYRKKLAEDPAFVPHLGEFWGHDDRFIKDEFKDDFDSHYRKPSFASRGKGVWGNSPPRGRWGHDGFEELMKIEDEEKRKKEFQRRIQHRREFVPPAPRRRSHFHNISPKFNHSRPSNSIRSRGMFLPNYGTRNGRGNINSFNRHHRSESSNDGNSRNITSTTSGFNDNKSFARKDNSFLSRGRNGFRGRGHSSRHYMRSSSNRGHSSNSNQDDAGGEDKKNSVDQDKNSKKQLSNSNDVNNINDGQDENHKDNINTAAEKVELAQELTDVTSHVDTTSSSLTKDETESKEQESVHEKSDKESEVEITLNPQNKKAVEDSTSQSINNITSSFNDLSINNNQSDTVESLTTTDKDRVQINQASKRYSTRRAASSSITPSTQTNDSPVSGVSNNSRTSEIPPSAVFAPPFQPRALALSDENSISNEDSSNSFLPQKPETPVASYYTSDNLPQGLRNNTLAENNLSQPTSIPAPAPYATENNGMVYYYDPNISSIYHHYYYYPTHENTSDNSVKSSSFVPSNTTVQEINGVYYYPVYFH